MPLLEVVASSPAIVTVLPVALVSIPSPPVIVNVSPRVFVALPLSEDRVMSLAVTAPLDTVKFVELKLAIPLLELVASSPAIVIVFDVPEVSMPSPPAIVKVSDAWSIFIEPLSLPTSKDRLVNISGLPVVELNPNNFPNRSAFTGKVMSAPSITS